MQRSLYATLAGLVPALGLAMAAGAAELPKSTQKVLTELKVDASLMNGLDKELDVPKAWLDAAVKEGEVLVLGTWNARHFETMVAPFRERYPGIKVNYNRAGTMARGLNVVIALKQGRVIGDVLTSFADAVIQFKSAKVLGEIGDLPGFKNVDKDYTSPDKTWVSHKISYRCIGYNTKAMTQAELPKTWDDVLTNEKFRNSRLAITNHPNSWLLGLWAVKGQKWGENFTRKLFLDIKPMQRKEGMTAATALTVAGEFTANLPAPEWQVQNFIDKGAPVALACPEPVPVTVSPIGIVDKSPHKNAARVFVNWLLSREGQLMQYYKSYIIPAHTALDLPRFSSVSDLVKGKKRSIRDDEILGTDMHKAMLKMWNGHWTSPVGEGPKKKRGGKKKKKQQ
jgi:iron(III) transport system substrate-binding protein